MSDMSPWLPAEALKPAHFERAMSTLVADWGSHWFQKVKPNCRTRLREIGSTNLGGLMWRSWGVECSVSVDEAGRLALAEAMLDRSIAVDSVQQADRPLLADVTNRCLDDLIGRLSWVIDQNRSPGIEEAEPRSGPGICWEISLKRSGVTISLIIHAAALVRWRKALAPTSESPALSSLSRGLASQPLRIDLRAGQGSLTLAELENLDVGDVVMLDRPVDAPLELVVGRQKSGIMGRLVADEEALRLDIIEKKKGSK